MRAARLRTALRLWLRDGDEQRLQQLKLRRSLGMLRNRLLTMAWHGACPHDARRHPPTPQEG